MAGNNIKGITVQIGADTAPLDKALKGVNKTSSDLQKELKQVNYQLKFDPKNTVLLKQKQDLLTKSVTSTKEKLVAMKTAETQAQAQFAKGKISEEQYRALQREVIKTESQLKNLEKQARSSNATLSKITQTTDKIAKGSKKVGQATTPATVAVIALGGAAVKLGSDFMESQNKVEVAFGSSAKSVIDFSKTTLDSFGIAAGTALDMSSNFGDMATSMGLPQSSAAKMSEKLVGLGGDLASFKNISLEESNTALTGIFTGETESLKKLGIVMTQKNLQEFAASKGIKTKIADMSQQEQVQLRYNYVMEKTKNAQGDFARTSDGAANSMRVASESTKEASASIGVILAPIIAKAAQLISNLAKKFGGLSDGTKKTILVIAAIIAVIAPLAFLISGIATIVGAVTVVITFLTSALFLTMLPIIAIVAGIALLVGGFIYLWKHCEGFRTFWINLWVSIKTTTINVINGIKIVITTVFNTIKTVITTIFNGIKTVTNSVWNGIKSTISGIVNGIKSTVTSVFNGIKSTTSTIWNGIKTAITTPFNAAKDIIKTAIDKIKGFLNFSWSFPKLKMPHFNVSGSINPINWLKDGVPKLGVEWYDKGGIFNTPQVIGVGEKRPEFVGALDDLRTIVREESGNGNNTPNIHIDRMIVTDKGSQNANLQQIAFLAAL